MAPSLTLAMLTWLVCTPALAQEPAVGTATIGSVGTDTTRIAIISDLNERYGDTHHRETVHTAVERLIELQPDIILVTGDMVAGQRGGLDYPGMWAAFHSAVTERLGHIPFAVSPGNHDASAGSSFADERAIYRAQWQALPRPDTHGGVVMVDGEHYPLRYSFRMGATFFVALDATRRSALERGDQLDWLQAQLESEASQQSEARVLFAHLPLLPVARGRERDYLLGDDGVRQRVEGLLAAHRVTLFASGHHHAYFPGRYPGLNTRLVAVGCLGGGPRVLLGDDRTIEDLDDPTERSFVMVTLSGEQVEVIEAFRGPEFRERVELEQLPDAVGTDELRVVRH